MQPTTAELIQTHSTDGVGQDVCCCCGAFRCAELNGAEEPMKMPCFLSATMDLGQFTEASLLNCDKLYLHLSTVETLL